MKTYPVSSDKDLNKALSTFIAKEPAVSYKAKSLTFDSFLNDTFSLMQAIAVGIPYSLFEKIQNQSPYAVKEWADLLDISYKSMQRLQSSKGRFKPSHSEKIFEFAEVFKYGKTFFGEVESLRRWLDDKTIAFGGMRPIDCIKSSYGKELVIERLVNFEHGIFI